MAADIVNVPTIEFKYKRHNKKASICHTKVHSKSLALCLRKGWSSGLWRRQHRVQQWANQDHSFAGQTIGSTEYRGSQCQFWASDQTPWWHYRTEKPFWDQQGDQHPYARRREAWDTTEQQVNKQTYRVYVSYIPSFREIQNNTLQEPIAWYQFAFLRLYYPIWQFLFVQEVTFLTLVD